MLAANLAELEAIRKDCCVLVRQRAALAAGAAAVPLPGVDAAADVAILLQLTPEINRRFGVAPEQIAGYDTARKQRLYQLIRRTGSALPGMEITRKLLGVVVRRVAGRVAAGQALRWVPLLGWAANAAIGFAAMQYIGNAHVEDCHAVCRQMLDAGVDVQE